MRHVLFTVVLLLLVSLPAHALPSSKLIPNAIVDLDETLGTPRAIRFSSAGSFNPRSNPALAIRSLMKAHAVFRFRDGVDEMRLVAVRKAHGTSHYMFQQYYHGIPVVSGTYNVSTDSNGQPGLLLGRFVPQINTSISSLLPAAAAAAAFHGRLGPGSAVHVGSAVIIHDDNGVAHVAYPIDRGRGEGELLYVSAITGHIVSTAHSILEFGDCSTTVSDTVNAFLTDAADTSSYVLRVIPRGDNDGNLGGCLLDTLYNWTVSGQDDPALSANHRFLYPAASRYIVPTNVFWHADRFFSAAIGMGFDVNLMGGPIQITVNDSSSANPASAVADTHNNPIKLPRLYNTSLYSPYLRNAGLAADVIYHEAQHLITHAYGIEASTSSTRHAKESRSCCEAISDYFAAALTNDPHINEWYDAYCTQAGASHDTVAARWLDSNPAVFKYSHFDSLQAYLCRGGDHNNGMILSGALWDLRKRIGARADTLMFTALSYLPREPEFRCVRDAVYQAAIDRYGSSYLTDVVLSFGGRGISGCWVAIDPSHVTHTLVSLRR